MSARTQYGIATSSPSSLLKALEDQVRREFEQKYPKGKGKFTGELTKEIRAEAKKRYDAVATDQSLW